MNKETTSWLQKQRVCVTGGQGRIGRCLVRKLIAGGTKEVLVISRSAHALSFDASQSKRVRAMSVDILDAVQLKKAISGCTVVFHLAGLTRVEESDIHPMRYLKVNGWGVAQLLEACRQVNIRRVIYTSSALVYGWPQRLPVRETHSTQPRSVYAASKVLGETILQGYAENFGFSCDVARLSNVYGGSVDTTTVIGSAIIQAMSGQGFIALKNLSNVRDFIHVDDVVEALIRLAVAGHNSSGCRIVNVSTNRGVSIRSLAHMLTRIIQARGMGKVTIRPIATDQAGVMSKLVLDNRLLQKLTGWTPRIRLEQGLCLALNKIQ